MQFDPAVPNARRAALRREYQVVKHEPVVRDLERWYLPKAGTEERTAAAVARERGVAIAAPSYKATLQAAPNDPRFSEQWALGTAASLGIDAVAGWAASDSAATTPVTVAVVDSGVDDAHPDLVHQMWTNPGEYGPDGHGGRKENNGVDDDYNTFVDDVHGLNVGSPADPPTPSTDHGTHVAGIIAAERNNGLGVAGVSTQARIMAVRAFEGHTGNEPAVVAGLDYAVSEGARIVSMSLGLPGNAPFVESFVRAHPEVLFVSAAGNNGAPVTSDGWPVAPCSIPVDNVLCVGAVNAAGDLAGVDWSGGGSNWGPDVDISAPGDEILSTVPSGDYASKSGTSMATPVVTGAAAVLQSLNPTMTPVQIKDRLMKTSDPIANVNASTAGRLNLARAVTDTVAPAPGVGAPTATVRVSGTQLIYTAAPGGKNAVVLQGSGGTYDVTDRLTRLTPGTGCTAVGAATVRCSGVTKGSISTDDLGDSVRATANLPLTVATGTGPASVITGDGNDFIQTGDDADEVRANGGADVIITEYGDDHIDAGAGSDLVEAGDGDDSLMLQAGNDTAGGGAGDDVIDPGAGSDVVMAGAGNDSTVASPGEDRIYGGDGNDDLKASDETSTERVFVDGGSGSDTLYGRSAPSTLIGGAGIDTVSYRYAGRVTAQIGAPSGSGMSGGDAIAADVERLVGSKGDDVLKGSDYADILVGLEGDDRLEGGGGDDIFDEDLDYANGAFGNDEFIGGPGIDAVDYRRLGNAAYGAEPTTRITATLDGERNDGATQKGEDDLISADVEGVYGGNFNDTLTAGTGPSVLQGGPGADILTGGPDGDSIYAQDGAADTVSCGGGYDYFRRDSADAATADCESSSLTPRLKITGSVSAGTPTNDTTPAVEFEAGGGADLVTTCRVAPIEAPASATPVPCTSPWHSEAVLTDGDYVFWVTAKTPTSNTASATLEFSVDSHAPDTTLTAGPTGTITTDSTSVSFVGTEPGVRFECNLDSGLWRNCTSPWTVPDLVDGPHRIRVQAIDAAGNVQVVPDTRDFTVAVPGPETKITAAPGSPSELTNPSFTFESQPGGAAFECKIDSQAWGPCTSPKQVTGLSAGEHTFRVRGTLSNETDPSEATHTWTVDPALAPNTTVLTPSQPVNTVQPVLEFTSEQPDATFECAFGTASASNWRTCVSPWTSPAQTPGQTVVYRVRARSLTGVPDASPVAIFLNIDLTVPETTISSGPTAGADYSDVQAAFEFTATDAYNLFIDRYECKRDTEAWAPCTSPYRWTNLPLGTRTFQVRSFDIAGNASIAVSRSFQAVTPVGPTAAWVGATPSGTRISDPSPTLRFSATPGTDARFECDAGPNAGSQFKACVSPWTTPIQNDGPTSFKVRAIGPTGLVGPITTLTYTVDTVAPGAQFTAGPADGALIADRAPSFGIAAVGESSGLRCRLDAADWGACSTPVALSGLADGPHAFAVRAVDEAGNIGVPVSRNFTVGPILTVSQATSPTPAQVQLSGAQTPDGTPIDWVKWNATVVQTFVQKSGSPLIGALSRVNGGPFVAMNGPTQFLWTDAAGTTPSGNSSSGTAATGLNNALRFTVPAVNTAERTLRVWVSVRGVGVTGRLSAKFNGSPVQLGGSLSATSDTVVTGGLYTITYRPIAPTDTLTVDWTETAGGSASPQRIAIQAAAVYGS